MTEQGKVNLVPTNLKCQFHLIKKKKPKIKKIKKKKEKESWGKGNFQVKSMGDKMVKDLYFTLSKC